MLSLFLGALPSTKLPVREGFASRRERRALVIRVRGRIPLPRGCFLARETAGALGPTPASRQEGGLARVSPYASRDEQPLRGASRGRAPSFCATARDYPAGACLSPLHPPNRPAKTAADPRAAPSRGGRIPARNRSPRPLRRAPSSCIGGSADGARRGREGSRASDPSSSGRSSSGSPGGPDLSPKLRVPPSNESAAGDAVVGRQLGVELLQDV